MTPFFPSSFLFLPWDWCRRSKKRRPRSFVRPLAARDRRRKVFLSVFRPLVPVQIAFFFFFPFSASVPQASSPFLLHRLGSWRLAGPGLFFLPKCQWPQLGLRGGGGHRISVPFFSFFLIPPFRMVGPGSLSPLFSNTLVVRWVAASAAKLNE